MTSFRDPSYQDRVGQSADAKKKALEQLLQRPEPDAKTLADRKAASERRDSERARKSAEKKDAAEAEVQARVDAAAKAAAPVRTEAERKAARDARYAARKKRR